MEMQDYFAKLKKKTGLNQLWSGRKFRETIDKDLEIDLSEQPRLLKSALNRLTLDSDEEELQKFIKNLSDDEQTTEQEEASKTESSNSEVNLMKNINFADAGDVVIADHKQSSSKSDSDDYDDRDFMPNVVRPEFEDESASDQDSESYQNDIFKNTNVNFVTSDLSSLRMSNGDSKGNTGSETDQQSDGTVSELAEEIPEVNEDSRVKTPGTLRESFDYTGSRFESFESEEITEGKNMKSRPSSRSTRTGKKVKDLSKKIGAKDVSYSDYKKDKSRRRKGDDDLPSGTSSSKTSVSTTLKSRKTSSEDATSSSSVSSSLSTSEESSVKHRNRKEDKKKDKKIKKSMKISTDRKARNFRVGIEDLGAMDAEMLRKDNFACRYLDPSHIATTVVDKDALEAVTSYNPAMLALNDLLKYQIQLTKQHIENSWRLYNAYVEPDVKGRHRYTTLKDTLKYIKKNTKSVVSYEEALQQIKNQED